MDGKRTRRPWLTNVIGNRTLNELMVGHAGFLFGEENLTRMVQSLAGGRQPVWRHRRDRPGSRSRISLSAVTLARPVRVQDLYQVRNSLTTSCDARGRHDVKIGGGLFLISTTRTTARSAWGSSTRAAARRRQTSRRFCPMPSTQTPGTWRRFRRWCDDTLGILKSRRDVIRIPGTAWMQDDWHMNDRLTLNLGVRYDLLWNMFQNQEEFLPFMESGRPQNTTNIQPRLRFTYQWDTQTVVRGGIGKCLARWCRRRTRLKQRRSQLSRC